MKKKSFLHFCMQTVQPLKDILVEKIAKDVANLPPLLFEQIFNEAKKQIEKDMRKKIYKEIQDYLPFLVEEFLEEEINSYTSVSKNIPDFKHIPQEMQDIACETAIIIMKKYEDELTENHFALLNRQEEEDDSS